MRAWHTPLAVVLAGTMTVASAAAQGVPPPAITVPPVNVLIPNYSSVPVGEIGSLEANAYLVRADASSAAWYNPAGLTRAEKSSVSGSAGVFQFGRVNPAALRSTGASFQQVPSLVSFVVRDLFGRKGWAGGFSLARVNAWSQSVDTEREFGTADADERVRYSSLATMSGWMANLGVAHRVSAKARAGATLDAQMTATERAQTLTDQHVTQSALGAFLIDAHGTGQTYHLRASFGVQYDVTPTIRIGALLRSPGLLVYNSGSYTHDGLAKVGSTTTTASVFAPSLDVEYRIPFQFQFGAAYLGRRARIEADLLDWAPGGTYDAVRGNQAWTITTDPGTGVAPTVQTPAYVAPVIDARSVVNVAVGGQVHLTSGGSWMVHGGYATDRSPVGAGDTYFTKVHMQVLTAGISGRTSFLLGSVAVRYEAGTSADVILRQLQNGQQITTRFKVSTIGIVYSLALLF